MIKHFLDGAREVRHAKINRNRKKLINFQETEGSIEEGTNKFFFFVEQIIKDYIKPNSCHLCYGTKIYRSNIAPIPSSDGDYIINMTVKMEKQKLQLEIITFYIITSFLFF